LALPACGFSSSTDALAGSSMGSSDAGSPPASGALANENQKPGVYENDFVETVKEPNSTFAADVDTGSYSLMRGGITADLLPSPESVRSEEFINYFKYTYPQPTDGHPFSVSIDGAPSKFGDDLHLVRIGLQGVVIPEEQRKSANLVFLVDVSGSM